MTITRIWQAGFDSGGHEGIDTINDNDGPSTDYSNTGSYSLKCSGTDSPHYIKVIPATRRIRGCVYSTINQGNTSGWQWWEFRNSSNYDMWSVAFNNDGSISMATDGTGRDSAGGVLPALPNFVPLAFDYYGHNTNGWLYVWANGVLKMSYTGNTNTNSYDIENWKIGKESGGAWWGTIYFDDIYIDDATGEPEPSAAPPPLRFYAMTPNATATYSGWLGSDGNKANNYLLLDEIPPNTSDYVEATVTGLYDSYAMTNVTIEDWQTPQAIIPYAYGSRENTTELVKLGTRYSSNEETVSGLAFPTGSYDYKWARFTSKPGGGAWDEAAISGYELLVVSEGTI
jgi:hypothetical protein